MAYLTCPWCKSPQLVADEAAEYQCYTCYGDVRFSKCPNCNLTQTVNKNWTSFTCGKCARKVDIPREWSYGTAVKAFRVEGIAKPFPDI
jgi:RecJ-like exonuclease